MSATTPLFDPQQQPPPTAETQQFRPSNQVHGSVGPVIAALAVITILGAIAVMIGRLCSGRRIMGYPKYYDIEGWLETKCSSCIDGRIDFPPPRMAAVEPENTGGDDAAQAEASAEASREMEQDDPHERPES